MPILNIKALTLNTAGDNTPYPPDLALAEKGALVRVIVRIPKVAEDFCNKFGFTIPEPIEGWACIDTGAATTTIDETIAEHLQMPETAVFEMASASGGTERRSVYPVDIEIIELCSIYVPFAMSAKLKQAGIDVLLGRDFLRECTLCYNGITGEVSLAIKAGDGSRTIHSTVESKQNG